jgi:vancomycin resistance protein VanW
MKANHLFPYRLRLAYRMARRKFEDVKTGTALNFAKGRVGTAQFPYEITIIQTIKQTGFFDNKVNNIQIASQHINGILINEGRIFSFWNTVGFPGQRNGYRKGRNLVSGRLIEDYGGGLCQLSGIMYHLALKAGLEIMERHNHSVDIYTEEERFTPLGSDATVVYGYKDLRFRNPYAFSLNFRISIDGDQLNATLKSEKLIHERNIVFERTGDQYVEKVITKLISEAGEVQIGFSAYRKEAGL